MLTSAQLITLKADMDANHPTEVTNGDAGALKAIYNADSSPSFTVWKTRVSLGDVGTNIDGAELSGLSTADSTRTQLMFQISPSGINPAMADRRAFFDDVFSAAGGNITRPKLLTLWKRLATELEKLFATGTGSDADPGNLVFEGQASINDMADALSV